MRVAVAYAPKTLDPALAADAAAARLLQLTNPALLAYNSQFQPVPLAGSCTQTTLTQVDCTLPTNRRFHDGSAFTAPRAAAWYRFVQTNKKSPFSGTLQGVTVTATAPGRLSFTLVSPTLTFLNKLTEIPLAPPPASGTSALPMGARPGLGLYRLAAADTLGNVTLVRTAPTSDTGTASPPALQFLYVADATTRLLKLKKHEVDVVQNDLPPELYRWGLAQNTGGRPWQGVTVPSSSYSYLGYNFRNETLANPLVRQGLAHAVNRPAIRQYLLGGLAAPAASLLPPGHPLAWPAPEETFDRAMAEDAFDAAGLFPGPDDSGANDVRATLTLLTSTDALSQRLAQVLQAQLRRVGIRLVLQPTEWGAFFDRVRSGRFDMVLLTWTGDQPPEFLYHAFHTSQVPPVGLNRGAVSNPALDATLAAIMAAQTPAQLAQATVQAQQQVAQVRPYLPLYRRQHTLLMAPAITGCTLTPDGGYKGLFTCRNVP